MDVKSAFLNGKLKEEVYVKQPRGFESSEFPDYGCKLDKALYGLKQAPKAWYETLSTFLIQNKFAMGRIDNTLFIYKSKGEVILVQVHVDDIIFGSTSYTLCKQFEKLMTKKFEMSMMGELTYFLGFSSVKTPMVPPNNLGPDLPGKSVNETSYRGMIGSLMYLTATRHDIQFFTVLCVRYQSNPNESHLIAVKRILRYLTGTPTIGLYYPKCSGFDLKGYSNSDYAGCNMDEKAPQVPAKYLVENWFVGVPRNSSQWLYPELKLNMLLLLVVYQNFLREFWSTAVAFDPFPSTDEPEKRPLKEFLIKFSVLNGQRPLTLDFHTFCSSTGLDYNNGKYVAHPAPEVMKEELGKIAINPSYLDKTPVLKNSFPMAWRILFTFVIQVLGGNYSSTEQVNFIQQLLVYSLITRIEVDIGEIIYSDLVTKLLDKSRLKYVSYPRFISYALQVLLGSEYTQDKKFGFLPPILSNSNFTKYPSKVTDIKLTAHMIDVNNRRDSVSPPPLVTKLKKGKSQTVASTSPKSQGREASRALSKKRKKSLISSGTVHDPQDLERDIQLASIGLPSTLDEGTRQSKPLPEGTAKTTPRPEGSLGNKDSGGNIPPADMEPIHTLVADPLGTGAKYQVDETQSTRLRYRTLTKNKGKTSSEVEPDTEPLKLQTYADIQAFLLSDDELDKDSDEEEVLAVWDDMDEDPQDDKEVRTPSPKQDQPEPSHVQESASDSSSPDLKKFDNILPLTERQLIKYLRKISRASVDRYYDENITHIDQTDKLVEASMSSLDRSSTTISDLYKSINVITELFKDISNAITDNPATNQKLNEATKTFARISSNVTEVLSLVKGFDFSALLSAVKSLQDHVVKQKEASTAWIKSKDTFEIKSMMTEMYATFQGHPSSAPSGSVTPTLAFTDIQANVKGENANTTTTEEPPSHTEGKTEEPRLEILISSIPSTVILPTQAQPITSIIIHPESSQATPKIDKGKGIATESDDDPSKKLVKASSIICLDPDEPVRDKEEQIKKVEEEAKLNAISKPKVIKVVRKEAKKLGIHPKEAITTKVGELFKKAQDAEHEIHPKTKLVVITVYKGTDGRNFDVNKPFLFGAFGISELDELREIIPNKKNTVVKDLMNSLSQRSGGLISVWDPNYFVKDQIWCDDYFIIVQGKWVNSNEVFYMINIYGPHETVAKTSLWSRMMDFIVTHEGHYIIFGDMNEVHDESERHGTVFSRLEAHTFNSFIDDTGLVDLPLGGRSYTWMNKEGTEMSKLDRFLVSNSVMDAFPDLKVTALARGWSDHILLMLHNEKVDYGPVPFRFFHSWMQRDGFEEVIKTAYEECSQDSSALECGVTMGEVKAAVWECGNQKALGPDGFSFLFIKKYWEIFKYDIEASVVGFFDSYVMPKGSNSSFITLIPKVFYLASGLRINIAKSNVYGIRVSSNDIVDMARATGCASGTLPFIYLGLPISSNMNLIVNWQYLIDRFRGKLSSWKASLLSIGGRLTLIKAGEY
ncbi:retrovirus-related pol polyprotein from transposon TNT 1-94 [Tanacetum coccineum]|uniref:Retrovirus-related pol polyprotein from transposon TNT 1-94 n=1 Tax=Tanacetum coccineum TaxID=301880 RepID=A0ABQ5G3S5_9ASTR